MVQPDQYLSARRDSLRVMLLHKCAFDHWRLCTFSSDTLHTPLPFLQPLSSYMGRRTHSLVSLQLRPPPGGLFFHERTRLLFPINASASLNLTERLLQLRAIRLRDSTTQYIVLIEKQLFEQAYIGPPLR
jgi:hypothetical protein